MKRSPALALAAVTLTVLLGGGCDDGGPLGPGSPDPVPPTPTTPAPQAGAHTPDGSPR